MKPKSCRASAFSRSSDRKAPLFREGLALVRLVFQVIHIVERVVHGDADDHAPDAEDDEGYGRLEKGDDAEGEERPGQDGHENPENVDEAFVAQPKDDGDEDGRQRKGQQRVFLDAGGIPDGHFRTARRGDGDVEIGRGRPGLDRVQERHQVRVPARFAAAEGRIEEHHAGAAVLREQEAVLHPTA